MQIFLLLWLCCKVYALSGDGLENFLNTISTMKTYPHVNYIITLYNLQQTRFNNLVQKLNPSVTTTTEAPTINGGIVLTTLAPSIIPETQYTTLVTSSQIWSDMYYPTETTTLPISSIVPFSTSDMYYPTETTTLPISSTVLFSTSYKKSKTTTKSTTTLTSTYVTSTYVTTHSKWTSQLPITTRAPLVEHHLINKDPTTTSTTTKTTYTIPTTTQSKHHHHNKHNIVATMFMQSTSYPTNTMQSIEEFQLIPTDNF